jgi:hypothetical protein
MKWPTANGTDLRLEKGCHEERMLSEFDRLDPRIISSGPDSESMRGEMVDVCRRDSEITPMEANEGRTAAERVHAGSWYSRDGALLCHEAACQAINHERRSARCGFGVLGIAEASHISCKLDDRVLKPAACSKERLA